GGRCHSDVRLAACEPLPLRSAAIRGTLRDRAGRSVQPLRLLRESRTLTTRPRVLLTRKIPSSTLALLTEKCDVDLYDGEGAIPREDLKRRVGDKDGVIAVLTDRIDAELMDAGAALKVVANIAVGYDNIDVPAARQRGIIVTNTPDVLTEAVAELTWALILGIARRVAEGDRLIRADGWKGWSLDFMLGTELRGKQLGIIGAGRIGRAVAAKAPAFGMTTAFAT